MMKEYNWTYEDLLKQIYKFSTSKIYSYTNRYIGAWLKEYCTQKGHFSIYTFREIVKKEMDKCSIFDHNFALYMFSAYIALAICFMGIFYDFTSETNNKMEQMQNNLEVIQAEHDEILKSTTLNKDEQEIQFNIFYHKCCEIADKIKEYSSEMSMYVKILVVTLIASIVTIFNCSKYKHKYNNYYNIYIAICEYIDNDEKQRNKEDCSYIK